jgi:hypothetical protein
MINEFLNIAASDINSGNPLTAASKICGIPRRTRRDWVNREGYRLKKVGRNAVLPVDAEKQLHHRIVRLQEVGFELTQSHTQVCCSNMPGTQRAESVERLNGGKGLKISVIP